MTETVRNQDLIKLEYLSQKLSEIDIESRVLTKTEELGLGTMVVALDNDYKNRDQLVNLALLPRPDDELEHINLMQFYVELPESFSQTTENKVKDLLTEINARMPIGHFGINEERIYCRYVMVLPDGETVNEADIIETLFLFADIIGVFQEMIEDLAQQRKSLDAIKVEFAF
ncbi:YbjN domain-containing protein [Fusibacter sp. JL216-2]|uniref:YbjN domain-containing protein n=1 Tax=Fusibacter sp. JL216-2 TaxID=3071453 RepID=UPI003D327051